MYRANDGNSFFTDDPMILGDRIKFEILNEDGTSLHSPARSPFERRSNENDDQFIARMEELAASARAAMNKVQPPAPPKGNDDQGQQTSQGQQKQVTQGKK